MKLPEHVDFLNANIPNSKEFKDSGTRQHFATGAVRDVEEGKGRFDLLPPFAMLLLAMVYEKGAKKYSDRNWEKGIPISRFLDAAMRHLMKYESGMRDEPHLAMAAWNVMCALQTAAWSDMGVKEGLNDLPNHFRTDKEDNSQIQALSTMEREYLYKWFNEHDKIRG